MPSNSSCCKDSLISFQMINLHFLRLCSYWGTLVAAIWALSFYYIFGTEKGREWYMVAISDPILGDYGIPSGVGSRLIALVSPILVMSSISALFVTTAPLPSNDVLRRLLNRCCASFRKYPISQVDQNENENENVSSRFRVKRNQFGLGEINFDYLAFFLIVVPSCAYFLFSMDRRNIVAYEEELTPAQKSKAIANVSASLGCLALSFFLIPVARHSVLLSALGWAPIKALRLHIWSGYVSFFFLSWHGIMIGIEWFAFRPETFWNLVIPSKECWRWDASEDMMSPLCKYQWFNMTGLCAIICFGTLIVTSINWVRRRYYRVFYISHMVFGLGFLLAAVAHWRPLITYILPSVVYYIASTTPTLVQALASFTRGGVKVLHVAHLRAGGGDCMEIHIAVSKAASTALHREPCMYAKICVPQVSLVWHPFTVYTDTHDTSTVRMLIRPTGPFTMELAKLLGEGKQYPVILMDGFYSGGDRLHEALQHDQVTMVAGGIAITPFLSFIPGMLKYIQGHYNEVACKSIVFHWVCREEALIKYVESLYFDKMLELAREISGDFELEIHLHHTKSRKTAFLPVEMPSCMNGYKNHDDFKTSTVVSTRKSDTTANIQEIAACQGHDQEDIEIPSNSPKIQSQSSPTNIQVSICKNPPGCNMELARMKAGCFHKVWQNIPLFVSLSVSIWIGYYILLDYSLYRSFNLNAIVSRWFGLIVTMVYVFVFSVVIEASALIFGVFQPSNSGFNQGESSDSEYDGIIQCPHIATSGSQNIQKLHHKGRPSPEVTMARAKTAEAPGLFICGPSPMTSALKKEAATENSIFGKTRFCLYEDPFEM